MKEFLVKIERVTKKSGPNQKTSQRGEQYDSYNYDIEISAGDDMFIVSKFIAVDTGKKPDDALNRANLFVGAVGTMKISSSIGDYTKDGETYRIERKRIESFTCYNKREEAEAQGMIDAYAQSQAAMREAAAVQAQMAQAQSAQQAAQAAQQAAVAPEMPNETVLGDGSGLPF